MRAMQRWRLKRRALLVSAGAASKQKGSVHGCVTSFDHRRVGRGARRAVRAVGARAQAWPSRQLRLVIPFPPGGAQDNVGRLAAAKLQERLGQQVIADNRPGASGVLAADIVKNSPADGYTILLGNISSHAVNPHTMKISYDPFADFIPVAGVGAQPNLLCANVDFPHDTIPKLVEAAKKDPGKIHYGSSGTSTSPSLSMALFKQKAGVDLTLAAYKGAAPASTDAIAGHIPLVISNYDSLRGHAQQGKLKAVAVTGAKRSPTLPNVPTFAESGYPDVVVDAWAMLFVPKGTPADVVVKMHTAMNAGARGQGSATSVSRRWASCR